MLLGSPCLGKAAALGSEAPTWMQARATWWDLEATVPITSWLSPQVPDDPSWLGHRIELPREGAREAMKEPSHCRWGAPGDVTSWAGTWTSQPQMEGLPVRVFSSLG